MRFGHNWSACHCNQMACTGGGADSDCGVMNSFINGSLAFGNRAITAIVGYRNNTANCLTDCDNPLFVDAAGPDPSCAVVEIWYSASTQRQLEAIQIRSL